MDNGKAVDKPDAQVSETEVQDHAANTESAGHNPRAARIDQLIIAEGSGARNLSRHRTRNQSRSSRISSSIFRGRSHTAQDEPTSCELRRAATRSREQRYRTRIASMSRGAPSHRSVITQADHCVNPNYVDHCVWPSADRCINPNFVEPEMPDIFTLAGNGNAINKNFVEKGYADLNPEYARRGDSAPLWSLAKPLPRVVRKAMVPEKPEFDTPPPVQNEELDLEGGGVPLKKKHTTQLERVRSERERAYLGKKNGTFLDRHPQRDRENEATRNRRRPSGFGRISEENVNAPQPIHSQPVMDEDTEADIGLRRPGEDSDTAATYADDDSGSSATEIHDVDDPAYRQYNEEALQGKHGLLEDNAHTHWSVVRSKYKEPLAELLAVVLQLTLGFCADLSTTAGNSDSGFTTSWAWGLATMVGIYIAGGISGAHLNPAISIMLWIYRGFPVRKIPIYVAAQILGAFIAALIAFGLYKVDIMEMGGISESNTAGDFLTYPRFDYVTGTTAFFNEFVGTTFLAITVMALGDDSNAPPGAGMNALIIGLVVTVHGMAFGYNTGAALNPSRDFGPRLALYALGYGKELFTNAYWIYGPWAATIFGALFGAGIYDIMIFVGGESPINYPRERMRRAAHLWKGRMEQRVRRVPKRLGMKKRRSGKKDFHREGS